MKQIIVQSLVSSTQTAVIKGNKLVELLIEDNIHKKTKSNIYRGIVKNIKPGIEAAFVDIGFEKMAYLPIKSSDNIKNGMEVLVQINKEGVGTKAPKLTQEISLSGRYLVLIPSNDRITISNKILEEKERFRLKKIVKSFNKEKLGIIIRTEAVNCDIDKLKEDFDLLIKRYQEILKQLIISIPPGAFSFLLFLPITSIAFSSFNPSICSLFVTSCIIPLLSLNFTNTILLKSIIL